MTTDNRAFYSHPAGSRSAGDMDAQQVIQRVRWLESDQLLRDMRNRARRRHELHSMLDIPDLPPFMTRGDAVSINGSDLIFLVDSLLADFQSYPTTLRVIPEGKRDSDFQKQSDDTEKWYAIARTRLDEGRRNSHDVWWHQAITGWAVMIFHCAGPDSKNPFPWTVEIPDPLTCFFPLSAVPGRPSLMGRRYTMLASDVINKYSKQHPRSEFAGQVLQYMEDEWQWATPLGEDQPVEAGDVGDLTTRRVGLPGVADSVEILEYYDQDWVVHVALNGTIATGTGPSQDGTMDNRVTGNGMNGQIVFRAKTMTDGIPVVIVPGHVTPMRFPAERMHPTLWPAMQCLMVLNMLNAMVMSREFNYRPDLIVEQNPELVQALKDAGILNEPTDIDLERGGPNIINVGGKPMLWTIPEPKTLEFMITYWTQKLNSFITSQMQVTTAEVAKESTLGGMQLAIGVRKRQQARWLANADWGWAEIMKMLRASMQYYRQEFPLFARQKTRYAKGELDYAQGVSIKSGDVDFPHEIDITTESMTTEERRMLLQLWAEAQALGVSTQEEGIEAYGYADVSAQVARLARDLGYKHNTSAWAAILDQMLADYVRTSGGILLPFGQPPSAPFPPGVSPQGAPALGGGSSAIPATGGVQGGSSQIQTVAGAPMT